MIRKNFQVLLYPDVFQKEFYKAFTAEFEKVKNDSLFKSKFEYLYSSSGPVEKWVKIKLSCGSEYEGKKLFIAYFEDITELKEDHGKLEAAKTACRTGYKKPSLNFLQT